jgi:hypothetical protein
MGHPVQSMNTGESSRVATALRQERSSRVMLSRSVVIHVKNTNESRVLRTLKTQLYQETTKIGYEEMSNAHKTPHTFNTTDELSLKRKLLFSTHHVSQAASMKE